MYTHTIVKNIFKGVSEDGSMDKALAPLTEKLDVLASLAIGESQGQWETLR